MQQWYSLSDPAMDGGCPDRSAVHAPVCRVPGVNYVGGRLNQIVVGHPSFHLVDPLIRVSGPHDLHHAKGRRGRKVWAGPFPCFETHLKKANQPKSDSGALSLEPLLNGSTAGELI